MEELKAENTRLRIELSRVSSLLCTYQEKLYELLNVVDCAEVRLKGVASRLHLAYSDIIDTVNVRGAPRLK